MICDLESELGAFLERRRVAHTFCVFIAVSSTQDFVTSCAWNKTCIRPTAAMVAF